MEEAFTEMLLRDLREPWPVKTFSDAERIYQGAPDFRTEGEKRRDTRQGPAREVAEGRLLVDDLFSPFRLAEKAEKPSRATTKTLVSERSRALRSMERARLDKWDLANRYIDLLVLQFDQWGNPGQALNALLGVSLVTGGLTVMAVSVVVGAASILDDILTGGVGMADNPISFWVAMVLFLAGMKVANKGIEVLDRVLHPLPMPSKQEPDA